MTEMKETAFIMQNVSQRYIWIYLALSVIFMVIQGILIPDLLLRSQLILLGQDTIGSMMFLMLSTRIYGNLFHTSLLFWIRSLIVMDELGRATSSSDGFAIAWSCCEHLLSFNA